MNVRILYDAINRATMERYIVRKVSQYKTGELFNIEKASKIFGLNADEFKSIPKKVKTYANDVIEKTGEYSKNPIKKIVSWVKSYIQNVKELFKEYKGSKNSVKNPKEAASAPIPKPQTIKFDKNDL